MQCHIIKAIASVNNKKNLLCQSRVHNAQIRRNSDARLMSRCFRGLVYFKIHFRALFHMKMWSLKDILNTFQIRSKNKLIGENVVTLVHEYCSLTPRYSSWSKHCLTASPEHAGTISTQLHTLCLPAWLSDYCSSAERLTDRLLNGQSHFLWQLEWSSILCIPLLFVSVVQGQGLPIILQTWCSCLLLGVQC